MTIQEDIARDEKRHGLSKTGAYTSWSSMKTRCLNPKNMHYHLYGGRGITVYRKSREDK